MSFASLMNNTMAVKRATKASDGAGGWTETLATIQTAYPCQLQPMSGEKRALYGKDLVEATHVLFCTVLDITEADLIEVDGGTYDIQMIRNIDRRGHHLEIDLRKIKPSR